MIENTAYMENIQDNGQKVCDNENSKYKMEITGQVKAKKCFLIKLVRLVWSRCRGKQKIGEITYNNRLADTYVPANLSVTFDYVLLIRYL